MRTSATRRWCRHWWLHGLVLLALCLTSAGIWADESDPEALNLLRETGEQAEHLHYQGILVYRHGSELETLRVIHRGGSEQERSERFYSLTGTPREVIRKPDEVICILPDAEAVVVDRRQLRNPISEAIPDRPETLDTAYQVSLGGMDRVAGRDAQTVLIAPRDELRFGHKLWIDREHGLLLRADLLDDQHQALEQVMFTEVSLVESVPDAWLEPGTSGESFSWVRPDERPDSDAVEPAWQIAEPPPGFTLISHRQRHLAGHDYPVEHLHFSDGLASVSVYVSPKEGTRARERRVRLGLMGAVRLLRDDVVITVVGEVPPVTLHRFAEGLAAASPAEVEQ